MGRTRDLKPIGLHDRNGTAFRFALPYALQEALHLVDLGAGGLTGIPEPVTNNQPRDRYLEERKQGKKWAFAAPADLADRLLLLENAMVL